VIRGPQTKVERIQPCPNHDDAYLLLLEDLMPVTVSSPIKTSGGKHYVADWIISLLPPRDRYDTFIDGMCRSCAVLLAHDPANKSELANDRDRIISNFWRVLQCPYLFPLFKRRVDATPFGYVEFDEARERVMYWDRSFREHATLHPIDVDLAVAFFILARMSFAGNNKTFTSITTSRLRRGMNAEVSAWLTSIAILPAVHARMQRVLVLDEDINELVRKYDKRRVVLYADPPYLLSKEEARVTPDLYGHFDWNEEQHTAFLRNCLATDKLYLLVSGYETELYNDTLLPAGWKLHKSTPQPLHSAGGLRKRRQVECVYTSY
jgi:DNA adenine methylase